MCRGYRVVSSDAQPTRTRTLTVLLTLIQKGERFPYVCVCVCVCVCVNRVFTHSVNSAGVVDVRQVDGSCFRELT